MYCKQDTTVKDCTTRVKGRYVLRVGVSGCGCGCGWEHYKVFGETTPPPTLAEVIGLVAGATGVSIGANTDVDEVLKRRRKKKKTTSIRTVAGHSEFSVN